MKKTMKVVAIAAILVVAMLGLAGCKKDKKEAAKDPIVGAWEYEKGGYTYTFNEDGTGSYSYYSTKMDFTYTTDGNKLSLKYNGSTMPFETEFSIDGDTLNVKDSLGRDTLYKKK